jgi:GntR family transcriptional repressor for pyruvate dehydrogenase complex
MDQGELTVAAEAIAGGRVGQVIAALHEHIRSNGLVPGDPLPSEGGLAAQLGVSRPVVREAFSSMAALKLIHIGNGRRARVSGLDRRVLAQVLDHAVVTDQITVQQILDVRRTVEMRTVELAALRRTNAEAAEITALAAAMRADVGVSERVMEHDIAFHEAIARTSKNPMFALVVDSFNFVTRQTWPVGWAARKSPDEHLKAIACHEAIAQAIADRAPRVAVARMAEHFDDTAKMLLAGGIT